MNYRKIVGILLAIALVMFVIGFVVSFPNRVGLCAAFNSTCPFYALTFSVGNPLYLGTIPLIIAFLIILLAKREVFDGWKWFAGIFLPIAVIWTANLPENCTSLVCSDRSGAAQMFGYIFLIITLIIAVYKTLRSRASNKKI